MPSPEKVGRNASQEIEPSTRRNPLETGNFGYVAAKQRKCESTFMRMTNVLNRLPVHMIGTSGMGVLPDGQTIGTIPKAASSLSHVKHDNLHLNTMKSFSLTHNSSMIKGIDQIMGDEQLESINSIMW